MQFHAEEMMVRSNNSSQMHQACRPKLKKALSSIDLMDVFQILECDVCGHGFATDGELFDHVTLAHLEDNRSCGECGMKFQAEPDLALHALQHTLDQSSPCTCQDCGQVCPDMHTFREHTATHMAVRPVSRLISNLPASFQTLNQKVAKPDTAYLSTEISGIKLSERRVNSGLLPHALLCIKQRPIKTVGKEETFVCFQVRPYHCDHCGRYFSRHSRFKQHVMSHFFDETMECWECSNCSLVFSDQNKAIAHNQTESHSVRAVILDKVYRLVYQQAPCQTKIFRNIEN